MLQTNSPKPLAFQKTTILSQHIAFLKDFFRAYKNFTDTHIDAIEIMVRYAFLPAYKIQQSIGLSQ